MKDARLTEIIGLLDPPPGKKLWFGGASPIGCLRGVSAEVASWKPPGARHSIWEFTLHIAYWKYAVRRKLEDSASGGFPRSPSNWPAVPRATDGKSWEQDRSLLRAEQQEFVVAVRAFDPGRLDNKVPGSRTYRFLDLLHGVVMHDTYHVGQIQLLKRMWRDKRVRSR